MTDWKRKLPKGLADNTIYHYDRRLKCFENWCEVMGEECGPPFKEESIMSYIAWLFGHKYGYSMINTTVSAMEAVHRTMDLPTAKTGRVKERLLWARRGSPRAKQAPAMRAEHFEKLDAVLGECESMRIIQVVTIMHLMRDCLLRRSELLALKVEDYDPIGKVINVRKSKSDQYGEGAVLFVSEKTRQLLTRWIGISEGAPGMPLFRSFEQGKNGWVTHKELPITSLDRHIKDACEMADLGFVPSSHSFRVGMAMDLADNGATVIDMQEAGRWKSTHMPYYYCRNRDARKGAVAQYNGEA